MNNNKSLTTIEMVENFIKDEQLSFLYISREDCNVCHGLLPQVENLLKKYPEINVGHVDADQVGEIASRFSIFTVPALLFFVNGKEYIREARIVHMQLLAEKINHIYKNVVT